MDELESLKWDLAVAYDALRLAQEALDAADAAVGDAYEALRDYRSRLDDAREAAAIDAYEDARSGR